MSEKRFYLDEEDRLCIHYDDMIVACVGCRETEAEKIVDLLNEQSERIKSLEMELDLIAKNKLFSRRKLEEENEQMKKQLEKIPKSIREVWLE